MLAWTPDFCPGGRPCRIEIERDWSGPRRFLALCPYHEVLRSGGASDSQLFAITLQSSRVKEAGRAAAKAELALSKDNPGLPFRVLADGSISIISGATGTTRTRVRNAVDAAVVTVSRPAGTSTVAVE